MARDNERPMPEKAMEENKRQRGEDRMTVDKFLDLAYPDMSTALRGVFLSKHRGFIKSESEWAEIVKAELSRKIQ